MDNLAADLVLRILASPVRLLVALDRVLQNGSFWQLSNSPTTTCGSCKEVISLVGQWKCRCGFTYRGHLMRTCPVCYSSPRVVRCVHCGVTEKLPEQ